MSRDEIAEKINEGLSDLYASQPELITNRCKEETICAHLICYLKELFKPWSVDLEYNRDGVDPKRSSSGAIIYPDIIIHNRTPGREVQYSPENNLAVIEVKGFWNDTERMVDEEKLRDMKRVYGYQYAFRVELLDKKATLIFIR